jgi:hypothetical protein
MTDYRFVFKGDFNHTPRAGCQLPGVHLHHAGRQAVEDQYMKPRGILIFIPTSDQKMMAATAQSLYNLASYLTARTSRTR